MGTATARRQALAAQVPGLLAGWSPGRVLRRRSDRQRVDVDRQRRMRSWLATARRAAHAAAAARAASMRCRAVRDADSTSICMRSTFATRATPAGTGE